MISDQAYLWLYLPERTEPVVCGQVAFNGQDHVFRYAQSYRDRQDAIALAPPGCALGELTDEAWVLDDSLNSAIRDACPDGWGRTLIMRHYAHTPGLKARELGEMDFLLGAGPERIGALVATRDAESAPQERIPEVPLETLLEAADRIDQGQALDSHLEAILRLGTGVGGARPKSLFQQEGEYWIAKFRSHRDPADMVGIEAGGMRLAQKTGIRVAETRIVEALGKRVLLVRRFDRQAGSDGTCRRHLMSAMMLLNLDEQGVHAGYSTYLGLADVLRRYARDFETDGPDLFRRMVFNILVGNIDDHVRNHACFWDGRYLELTPAYDVCPQPGAGLIAAQAMVVGQWGRRANLDNAISHCDRFGLGRKDATAMVAHMVKVVRSHWRAVFAEAGVPEGELDELSQTTILDESIFENLE